MRRGLSRFWPLAMICCTVTAIQVLVAAEADASPTSGAEQTQASISKYQSLKLLRHRFSGHMKVACQDRVIAPPCHCIGRNKRRAHQRYFRHRYPGLGAYINIRYQPECARPRLFEIQYARLFGHLIRSVVCSHGVAGRRGKPEKDSIDHRLPVFGCIDKIKLPENLNIAKCKASNLFHLKAM